MKLFSSTRRTRRLGAWITLPALVLSQLSPLSAWGDSTSFAEGKTLRAESPRDGKASAGLEEALVSAGMEERVHLSREIGAALDPAVVARTTAKVWNMSFSGLRTKVVPGRVDGEWAEKDFPLDARRAVPLSDGDWVTLARAGYLYGKQQLLKLRRMDPARTKFLFVLARDTRPTGGDVLAAQAAGMRLAAREIEAATRVELELSFAMAGQDGVIPTPMAAAMVRLLNADGGVIVTASHNTPDENGAKYLTAAREPAGAPVEAGVVLGAREMGRVVRALKQWMDAGKRGPSEWNRFFARLRKGLGQPEGPISVRAERIDPERIIEHVVLEQRRMLGLAGDARFTAFRERAAGVGVLVDPNGGASSGFYAEVARRFGYRVEEINGEKGLFAHWVEPAGERAMGQAKRALVEARGRIQVALVCDCDADRGNTVLLRVHPDGGVEAVEPAPWDVATLNLAIALGLTRGQPGAPAVVLHDFPDGRLRALARRLGAEVVNVETGEVNVLTEIRALQRQGRRVAMGSEQAIGGTVIPGLDPFIPGDTSRSGLTTLLLQAMAVVNPDLAASLFPAGVPEPFTLASLSDVLPGERAGAEAPLEWHVGTRMGEKLGRDLVPPEAAVAFKQKVLAEVAAALQNQEGVFAGELERAEAVLFAETERTRPAVLRGGRFPVQGWKKYGGGGMRITLRYVDGTEQEIWMRGSKTEGGMRIAAEVRRAPDAADQADRLLEAFQQMVLEITGQPAWWMPAGLEEALVTQPARGFTTRVARDLKDQGIQVAERAVGRLVGQATWNLQAGAVGDFTPEPESAGTDDQTAAERVLGWMTEGLRQLGAYADAPAVQRVRQRLAEQGRDTLPVEFRANHAMTLDISDPDPAVRLDVTVAGELGDLKFDAGRPLLYAMGLFHEQALAAGFTAREAIHLTLGLYSALSRKKREEDPDQEQEHLQKLLRAAFVDPGNTWAFFLEGASHLPKDLEEFAETDSLTLEDRLDTETDARARAHILRVLHHRDRLASWLEGQLKIDLPYDRLAFRKALGIKNLKQRRLASAAVIQEFDREVERENARRVSEGVRDSLPENMPYPRIVAGRASRAFGNQAALFANAEHLLRTPEMVDWVQELQALSSGEALLAELQGLVGEAPPAARQEMEKAVGRVKALLAHLGPGVDRTRQMILGPGEVVSSTQYEGALNQVQQNLEIFFKKASETIEQAQNRAVQASVKGIGRKPRQTDLAVPFQKAQRALAGFSGKGGPVAGAVDHLGAAMRVAQGYAAAFSVLMQRPSETGSENFKANELEEKPEQEEQLRELVRLGGQNLYMSPSYDWVAEATDVIEAAPLFIYERTVVVDGRPVTVFEVDQQSLEQTIRQMADDWAKNIDQTMDSEHVALAREIVMQGSSPEGDYRRVIREAKNREELVAEVGRVAAWIAREYDRRMEEVERLTEQRWLAKDFIGRLQAVRLGLIGDPKKPGYAQACRRCAAQARAAAQDLRPEAERLAALALSRRRPTPAFHMLTTEAPGLVEGFVQVVLEEEMTLRNIIRARGLEKEVQRRVGDRRQEIRGDYEQRILALGRKVIREFGYESHVEKRTAELQETEEEAVLRVVSDNLPISQEVARLAVLAQVAQADAGEAYLFDPERPDHPLVEQLLADPNVRAECEKRALAQVAQRNEIDLSARVAQLQGQGKPEGQAVEEAIRESALYRQELEDTTRREARAEALTRLGGRYPDLHLQDEANRWYREHTALAVTTARREVIASNKLNHLKMDPRYAYSAGTLKETADGKLRPTGGRKRYHLVYAPSRVNLGKGERESVEVWPQWVGVWDPLAAEHARQLYELMNYDPQIMTIAEAETHKVSENQWAAMVRVIRNVQAYFVGRLGQGDIEGLAYQFNQRGGLPVAAIKEGESYSAGPTAGYCIPKDLLFKLFVATLQDERKLEQVGLPQRLHAGVSRMMLALTAVQDQFETAGEWEHWVAGQMMSPEALEHYCGFGRDEAKEAQEYFRRYLEFTGGIAVPHLIRIREVLQRTGVPSPLLARGRDLYQVLLSNWAERKLTLPAEQVNRSIVFMLVRDMFQALDEARRLNPDVPIAPLAQAFIHLYGPYKGDETEPSPPDVRFSLAMRIFMILSGFWKEVGLSLDEKGQMLARLLMVGFRPDSTDPEDRAVVRYLAKEFAGREVFGPEEVPLVEELKRQFPVYSSDVTVGNIVVSVVPGVDADDLLGFNAETKGLLGDRATQAQETLQAGGISAGQMKANAELRRVFPEQWVPLSDLPPEKRQALAEKVGGGIHPMKLRMLGPGDDFLLDIQGQDVVIFCVTHPEIMTLNPAHLRDRMLTGRPASALVALDYVTQGRHRVWFDRDVMLWYAAGRGVDAEGLPILDWKERDSRGRKAVYRAFGYGTEEYKPLLGDDLRGEVRRQEGRARALYAAFQRVADAPEQDLETAVQGFRAEFEGWLVPSEMKDEASMALSYEQQLLLNGRWKPRDADIREVLGQIVTGLAPERFGEAEWLATGGIFLLNGAPREQRDEVLGVIRRAQERMQTAAVAAGLEEDPRVARLIVPRLTASAIQQAERKGEMFSVKAGETVVEKAVALRKGLALEAARLSALRAREGGFKSVQKLTQPGQIPAAMESARQELRDMMAELQSSGGGQPVAVHQRVGRVFGIAVQVLRQAAADLVTDPKERERIQEKAEALTAGRELDADVWEEFGGTYEDPGILARLFELAGAEKRDQALAAMELLYIMLALERTADFVTLPAHEVDERLLWNALAGFFAETMDDHYHEYNPWAFDPKRGSAFTGWYDELGVLKPERREELYRLSWERHRALYPYLRYLVLQKTGLREMSSQDQASLCGETRLGPTAEEDEVAVQAIGAGAPDRHERLWRGYNQLREVAFIRNDGFAAPVVFERMDPYDPLVLDAGRRVNHVFLTPVGRTHYSRALMEAAGVGDNLLITRDGEVVTPPEARGKVLQIWDGHFWLTHAHYRQALVRFRGMTPDQADAQIAKDAQEGRMTPKGIRVAARFSRPVTVGSVVPMHHHHLSAALTQAGYPYTDKSEVHYEITYDKSLYPGIFNPSDETGVNLPPEVDWLQERTARLSPAEAKKQIAEMLQPFAEEHRIIVVKGSAESGARNFKRFDLFDREGKWDEKQLREAVDFVYEVSKGQNVTIQRAIIVTPIAWMDPAAVEQFVERQIREHSVPVNLQRHPKSWIYGTLRIIPSAGVPTDLEPTDEGLFNPANWRVSHPISLSSLQVATNVGRQGTLEMLTPDLVRPEFRETFIRDLEEAGRKAMVAMARYGKRYWDETYVPAYRAKHGEEPQEFDAAGVPYWWPRYLMLDFLPEPVWAREDGQEVPGARVIDIVPGDPAKGTQARFTLKDPQGNDFEGKISRFVFWLLEPNVGIGLWPNYWRREEARERARAKREGREMDWSRVGVSDRVVLGNYLAAGEEFLRAKFGGDYFGPSGPSRGGPGEPSPAAGSAPAAEPVLPFEAAAAELRAQGVERVGPGEASLLLVEAAVAALGGREALRERPAEENLAEAERWLARSEIVLEFPQGDEIAVLRQQVGRWLADPQYRSRLAELAVDQGLSERLAPPVEVLPEPLSPDAVRELLPHGRTLAVVTGKRALMSHHLYPWEMGRDDRPVNVVGVHEEWLTRDGRTRRFIAFDSRSRRFVECACAEPVRLNDAFIVELPQAGEAEHHQRLHERLRKTGVRGINSPDTTRKRADDKGWLRREMRMGSTPADIHVPETMFVAKDAAAGDYEKQITFFAKWSDFGLVIQPRSGTTEGEGVEWFAPGNSKGQRVHIRRLAKRGDVMVSKHRSDVVYEDPETGEERPIVLRFNVAGGQVVSASAVVGPAGEHVVSLGRGGETMSLGKVLGSLQWAGLPVPVTAEDWARLTGMARRAAEKVGLMVVGLDMVLEADLEGLRPGIVLEANARPGTLIFGERPIFAKGEPVRSESAAAIASPAFWASLTSQAGLEEHATLTRWEEILADPAGSGFQRVLEERYGGEPEAMRDRLEAYRQLIQGALQAGFDPSQEVVVLVASPGRDRFFMGHTDFPGLGERTINGATQEEILAVLQKTRDGAIHLTNVDPQHFGPVDFAVSEVREVAAKIEELRGKEVWSPANWDSYVRAALAHMLAEIPEVGERLGQERGMRMHVASKGLLALPYAGGVSSSSALTGAFSMGLGAALEIPLSLEQLAQVDFSEYLLGKTAGAGDKTAQLTARLGKVVVVGSFPERFVGVAEFPPGLTVLMVQGPVPRLSTSDGLRWLEQNYPDRAQEIHQWAKETLARFGSRAYVLALKRLREGLGSPERYQQTGISPREAEAAERAFRASERYFEGGLLRELVAGGEIEKELPELAGRENRRARYSLIYRLLKLIPEEEVVDGRRLAPRKAALYGIAEGERGTAYLRELELAVEAEKAGDRQKKAEHIQRVLRLVERAHDGDRAAVDYRSGYGPTPWAGHADSDVSDAAIDGWIARGEELADRPGGYERSIPDLDEMADKAKQRFNGKVAVRVAAAGMGGAMAIHVDASDGDGIVWELTAWLDEQGWTVRRVQPGSPTQVIVPPARKPVAGRLVSEGAWMKVTGDQPVEISGVHAQLANGSWLSTEGGGRVILHPGARVGPFVMVSVGPSETVELGRDVTVRQGSTIEGQVTVAEGSQVWGVVRGHPKAPTVLGPLTQMKHPNGFIDHGVITVPVTDENGRRRGVEIYDAQIGEEAGKGPVVIWGGTDLKKGVVVRPNTVLGPYVHIGPGSEAKATYWMGASPNKNDSALAHRAYGGNLVGIPVYLDGTPLDDIWHSQLIERLVAFRFGRVVGREVEDDVDPQIRPREDLTVEFEGRRVEVSVRGLNFGDGSGASNFKSVSGGRKGIGVVSAGVAAGTHARISNPAFLAPDTVLDDHAKVKGMQAGAPDTYAVPVGRSPQEAIRPGQAKGFHGKSGGAAEARLFLANLRTLQSLARVSAAGLRHAEDPIVRKALQAEIQALRGHFQEIDAFTDKELKLLENSPDAAQVPELTEQARQLRAAWSEIESAAGLEEAGMEEKIELPAGSAEGKAVFLTPAVLTPEFLAGLARLRPGPGEQLALLAFAENAYGAVEAQKALATAGLTLLEPVIDLQSEYDGDLERAVKDKKGDYDSLRVQVVRSFDDLDDLGRFLQIPDVSFRGWKKQITGADLGVQA